jgi:hypothetical protein
MMLNDGKRCQRCLILKPLAAFHNKRRAPDGLQTWCRVCQRRASALQRAAAQAEKSWQRRLEILARAERGKACCRCGVVQPLENFAVDRRKPDGRASCCASCAAPGRRAAWARYNAKKAGAAIRDPQLTLGLNAAPDHGDTTRSHRAKAGRADAMKIDLTALRILCEAAHQGNRRAWPQLREIGRQALAEVGTNGMCEIQGLLHDAEICAYGSAMRGDGFKPAGVLSAAWEAIPEWANL